MKTKLLLGIGLATALTFGLAGTTLAAALTAGRIDWTLSNTSTPINISSRMGGSIYIKVNRTVNDSNAPGSGIKLTGCGSFESVVAGSSVNCPLVINKTITITIVSDETSANKTAEGFYQFNP